MCTNFNHVSIHHMCRFKDMLPCLTRSQFVFQYIICVGSSLYILIKKDIIARFQYIICVGSRFISSRSRKCYRCFNTSYVSVQALLGMCNTLKSQMFQYIICVGSRVVFKSSVLGFLSFNTSYVSVQVITTSPCTFISLFQYIICVGSREKWIIPIYSLHSFNTSYVSVQVPGMKMGWIEFDCFNTSYVSVQERGFFKLPFVKFVSIHHMCRFK